MLELEKRGKHRKEWRCLVLFNMGVGMVIVVDETLAEKALSLIEDLFSR